MIYHVEISGQNIVDKHTHYEVTPQTCSPIIGSQSATVIIRGDVATDFQKRYGLSIKQAEKFEANVWLGRNDARLQECQDLFKSPSHLIGTIKSIDDIIYNL